MQDGDLRTPASLPIALLTQRVRGEFLEMPGLSITLAQACRLWALEPAACEVVLDALVDAGLLAKAPSGQYRRRPD